MKRLRDLRNLGPKSELLLNSIGIYTSDVLLARGAIRIYKQLMRSGITPNKNLLYSLHGAIVDKDWRKLNRKEKQSLLMATHMEQV